MKPWSGDKRRGLHAPSAALSVSATKLGWFRSRAPRSIFEKRCQFSLSPGPVGAPVHESRKCVFRLVPALPRVAKLWDEFASRAPSRRFARGGRANMGLSPRSFAVRVTGPKPLGGGLIRVSTQLALGATWSAQIGMLPLT